MNFKFYKCVLPAFIFLALCTVSSAFGQFKPQTTAQMQKLIAEKQSRTPTERKISSQLLQATREAAGQPMTAGVLLRPANVKADAAGYLEVDINAAVTRPLLDAIKSSGGKIISSSIKFHALRAKVNLAAVKAIAARSEVKFIKPAAILHIVGGKAGKATLPLTGAPATVTTGNQLVAPGVKRTSFKQRAERVRQQVEKYVMMLGTGAVNSQGDHAMGADSARAKYGYAGQGIRIGVLSDSYNSTGGAAADVASGDLPGVGNPLGNTTPVTVVQDVAGSTDEGRAMLQIVHDLAPKAQLFFATADGGDAGFAANIIALRSAPNNCDIIIDDASYEDEPIFQDGIVAQAVNQVTASGALYFSSAGNAGSLLMNFSSAWEGDFNDAGSLAFAGDSKAGTIHNFGTVSAPVMGDSIITQGSAYVLNWADPLGASSNDYDLFLVDASGNVISSSTDIQDGSEDPFEGFADPGTFTAGEQLVVFKASSAQVRAFMIFNGLDGQGKGLKYSTSGRTFGHASAVNAYCVAATDASLAYPGVFTTSSQVEQFSSDGPRRIFYNADSTPVTPGNFLFATNGGVDRRKPDITAADGVSTNVNGTGTNFSPFYGTSAAAPHAGAIAALLKSASPSITPAQMRSLLTSTALDIEAPGYDINSGYGIVQALQAMQKLNPVPLPVLQLGATTATEGQFSNHNGVLDPGEEGSLVVQLLNPSMAAADSVTAVLTTTTAGVTIVQGSANYGNIAKGGSASNAGTPFTFVVSSSVPCGTAITFYISAAVGGGAISPQVFSFTVNVGKNNNTVISSHLGSTPPTATGYTAVSGQQTGRLSRGTVASSCASPIPADTLLTKTGLRQFDAYTFTNTTTADLCVSVTVTSANGLNIYTASYNSGGFIPSNPATNFVADPGQSATTMQYSFTAPAGKQYTIVVHDVNVAPASGSAYTLTLSYSACTAAPACTPVKITNTGVAAGSTGKYYSQTFPATGGSGIYSYSITGGLPAGLSFAGDSLFGTPTQAGSFPIVITVNDIAGCPSATQKDTIVIAGDKAASITTFAGTPQSTAVLLPFADSLKAEVFDASNKPLSGVNVIFISPTSGASGNFGSSGDTVTVVTNSAGIAAAPIFIANGTTGSYTVTATVTGLATPANFLLTNTCLATVVTSSADSGPGTLRYIITNACPDATVTFAPGINKITLTSGDLIVAQGITINGPGADQLTISGADTYRDFTITAPATSTVNLYGMTISDGVPQDTAADGGGGVLIYSGIVNINKCLIYNNDASLAYNAEGGGIDNQGGTLTVNNCSIIQNGAYFDGGGLALEGGTTSISNSTIYGNAATQTSSDVSEGGWGGGIFTATPLKITNCTVYTNEAQDGGNLMGIYSSSRFVTSLRNNIIAGGVNTPGQSGLGPDIYGQSFSSAGFNLIQDTSSGAIHTLAASDIVGIDPALLPLANYGGPTPTLLQAPNSPVINTGDLSLSATQFDQRGYTRVAAGRADIGSVEANYLTTAIAGTPQATAVKTTFAAAIEAKVTENGNAVSGVSVMLGAPVTGASGTFTGSLPTAIAVTNASGIATAPAFTANDTVGTYTVVDSIGAVFANAGFALTNTKALAVTFGRITAAASNCTVQITWQTLTGEAGETFTLEHGTNGTDFTALYATAGRGNSITLQTYSYTDSTPVAGANYYRVKQTDADGSIVYSSTIIVVNTCTNAPVIAYPNPVHNTLTLVMPGTAKQTINIYDAAGRLTARYASVTGTLSIDAAKWAGGVYTIVVIKEDKSIYNLKIIKN